MKKIAYLLILGAISFQSKGQSQNATSDPLAITIKYYGFVSYEAYVDTYNSVITRDGELYLYPNKPSYDSERNDMNKNLQTNMLALQSRIGSKISGPEALGTKTNGVIEADFYGTAEEYKNMLRIRHAYMTLKWEKTSILMGMYWHPLFTPECYPLVIGFGAAVPYNPLNRSPQIRVDHFITSNLKLVAAALEHSQGYHHSVGPEFSQRNASIPDIQVQLHYKTDNILVGIGGGYHQLEPRPAVFTLEGNTRKKIVNEEKLHAFNAIVFSNIILGNLNIKAKSLVGQNLTYNVMLGGYGRIWEDMQADSIKGDTIFVGNPNFRFTGLWTHANWVEVGYKVTEHLAVGFLAGISGNLGATQRITKPSKGQYFYDRNADIAYMFRLAPRVSYIVNNLQFALEYFYDQANYAKEFDAYYRPKIKDLETGVNHRILFSAKYFFD